MTFHRITLTEIDSLWQLHTAYKAEIGEDAPTDTDLERLKAAIADGEILFFGAFDGEKAVGCCSVTAGFSTFNYKKCGVFEDFYILPEYRHKGIARELVKYAYRESGVSSMTVGCAACDMPMYKSLGFSVEIGNMLAYE